MNSEHGSDGLYFLYENYELNKSKNFHGVIYKMKPLNDCRLEIHIPLLDIHFSWFSTSGRSNGLEK